MWYASYDALIDAPNIHPPQMSKCENWSAFSEVYTHVGSSPDRLHGKIKKLQCNTSSYAIADRGRTYSRHMSKAKHGVPTPIVRRSRTDSMDISAVKSPDTCHQSGILKARQISSITSFSQYSLLQLPWVKPVPNNWCFPTCLTQLLINSV